MVGPVHLAPDGQPSSSQWRSSDGRRQDGRSSSPQSPLPPPDLPLGGTGTVYGDWIAEIDAAAPIVSNHIYGDTIEDPQESQASGQDGVQDRESLGGMSFERRGSRSRRSKLGKQRTDDDGFPGASRDEGQREEERGDGPDTFEQSDKPVDEDHMAWASGRTWYQRPSERWLRPLVLLLATGSGMIMGPRIELGTQLVCEEILGIQGVSSGLSLSTPAPPFRAGMFNMLPAPHERPPLSSACKGSPAVEAGYTALALRMSLAMGILSAITTGFWGGLSDRKGRTLILRLSTLGLTMGDLAYIILGLFPQSSVPFGKNLLVVGAAFEGAMGGIATIMAAHMSYIADVTPNGTRATVFSFFTGLFFCGIAIGPSIGGLIAKRMHSTMAPFYFALGAHITYFVFASLFLPESNSPERMRKAEDEHRLASSDRLSHDDDALSAKTLSAFSFLVTPFRPLTLFLPHRRHDVKRRHRYFGTRGPANDHSTAEASAPYQIDEGQEESTASHISVSHVRSNALDWNLTFIAVAYFLEASSLGILTPKINYAMYKFNWDVEEIGYYLSFSSLTRVACLTIIVPMFVKWVHRPVQATSLPHDGRHQNNGDATHSIGSTEEEGAPLLDDDGRVRLIGDPTYGSMSDSIGDHISSSEAADDRHTTSDERQPDKQEQQRGYRLDPHSRQIERLWMMRARHLRQIHDSRFDRRLVIGSLAIAAISYLLLAIFSNAGPAPFVALSAVISLGGAASAGLSSLALALLENDRDAGKFFAAWSVLSALSQMIIGPVLFTAVFVRTVSFAPQSIFILGFGMSTC